MSATLPPSGQLQGHNPIPACPPDTPSADGVWVLPLMGSHHKHSSYVSDPRPHASSPQDQGGSNETNTMWGVESDFHRGHVTTEGDGPGAQMGT